MKKFPLHLADFYKMGHYAQYPEGTTMVYSNFTPRKSRVPWTNEVWTTDEIMNMPDEPHGAIFRLMLKFVNGNTNLQEEVALEIDKLLSNNNVDHISLKAIMEKSQEIIELIKTS